MGTKRVFLFNDQASGTGMLSGGSANVHAEDGTAVALINAGSGNTITFDSSKVSEGTTAMRQTSAGGAVLTSRFDFATACPVGRLSVKRNVAAAPGTNWQWMRFLDASGTLLFRLGHRSDGKLFASTFIGSLAESFNKFSRYEVRFNQGSSASNGALTVNAYTGNATGTPDDVLATTTMDLGALTNPVKTVELGTATAVTVDQWFDELQFEDLTTLTTGTLPSELGPYVPPAAAGGWKLGSIAMGS